MSPAAPSEAVSLTCSVHVEPWRVNTYAEPWLALAPTSSPDSLADHHGVAMHGHRGAEFVEGSAVEAVSLARSVQVDPWRVNTYAEPCSSSMQCYYHGVTVHGHRGAEKSKAAPSGAVKFARSVAASTATGAARVIAARSAGTKILIPRRGDIYLVTLAAEDCERR